MFKYKVGSLEIKKNQIRRNFIKTGGKIKRRKKKLRPFCPIVQKFRTNDRNPPKKYP
jgi:hypothetical protein